MATKKAVSLTEYAEAKGRAAAAAETPAPRPPAKPQPVRKPTDKPVPQPVPEEAPKPKIVNGEEEKRAKMLETLARARAIRKAQLAAQAQAQMSHKGGSAATAPAPKVTPTPAPATEPEPGKVPPTQYHPLPDHLEKRVEVALDEVRKGKVAAILVMFREE